MTELLKEFKVESTEARYIVSYECIYDALHPLENSIYQALRYSGDYSCEVSSVKMTIPNLAKKSKTSERKVNSVLNDLEFKYFIIKRHEKKRHNETNIIEVASKINHFSIVQPCPCSEKDSAPRAVHRAPHAVDSAPGAFLSLSNSLINPLIKEKSNKKEILPEIKDKPKVYKETYYPVKQEEPKALVATTNKNMSLEQITSSNLLAIPEDMLDEWRTWRIKNKLPATPRVWVRITKALNQCVEAGINPQDAFEEMITRGWKDLKVEWVQNTQKKAPYENKQTSWSNDLGDF